MRRLLVCTFVALTLTAAGPPAAATGPAQPEGSLVGVTQLTTSSGHTCARLSNGEARCWGDNVAGQLGNGSNMDSSVPVVVRNGLGTGPLTGVVQIAAGTTHTCALLTNRQVRCWGAGSSGQLGNGSTSGRLLPVAVTSPAGTANLTDVTSVAAGRFTTCALLTTRQVRCWGLGNAGQLGHGFLTNRLRPTPVKAVGGPGRLEDVTQIDVNGAHACARLSNGQARCWGANGVGQLGNTSMTSTSRPVVVKAVLGTLGPLTGVSQVALGRDHTCARLTNGQARCWGENSSGQLGTGNTFASTRPVVVLAVAGAGALSGVANIAAGFSHSCVRLVNGQARCWGPNFPGRLGDGTMTDRHRPVVVSNPEGTGPLADVTQVSAGDQHTCARLGNRQARCWGENLDGKLGDATVTNRDRPVAVIV